MSELGDIIANRWRLDRELGAGGFATVYTATDLGSGARVAIKMTRQQSTGGYAPETARRYQREIEVLERLTCQHTVQLLGHGHTEDGTLYLVFEHIDGEELAHVLDRRGRLSGSEVVHILEQLLRALDEAHRNGLLHRDLKPQNVLVFERNGDPLAVKLIDFGIARSLDPDATSITQTGGLVGTPKYMSPEQLLRLPLTPASDLYSLGMMGFEMALGRDALHGGAIGEQIDRLRSGHLFSAPELDRLGVELRTTISRMCAREPEDRFQSAHAVLHALGLAPGSPLVVSSPERRTWLGLAVVLVALLVVGWLATRETVQTVPAPPAPTRELPFQEPPTVETDPVEVPPTPIDRPTWHSIGCDVADKREIPENLHSAGDPTDARPLVVLLRDSGVEPVPFLRESGFVELANQHELVVLSLGGKDAEIDRNPWRRPEPVFGVRSDPFPEARREVVQTLEERCIDMRRIYAVGHGNGARAARVMACNELFAGLATVSGMGGLDAVEECRLGDGSLHALPRIRFNPLDSRHHPIFGGPTCDGASETPSLNEIDAVLAKAVQCKTDDPEFARRSQRQSRVWMCGGGVEMRSIVVPGGHAWGGVQRDPRSDPHRCDGLVVPDVDYPNEIWSFFEAQFDQTQIPRVGRPSPGCTRNAAERGRHLGVGGGTAASYVPTSYDHATPHPLVVLVHDKGANAMQYLTESGFEAVADEHRFLVLAPQGTQHNTWKLGSHQAIREASNAFADNACVDLDRVYAVGDFRGALAVEALACEDWFSANAIFGKPSDDIMYVRDKLQLPDGVGCEQLARKSTLLVTMADDPSTEREWAQHMGCESTTEPLRLGSLTCRAHTQCDAQLSFCTLPQSSWVTTASGHQHPGPRSAEPIWAFFESAGDLDGR